MPDFFSRIQSQRRKTPVWVLVSEWAAQNFRSISSIAIANAEKKKVFWSDILLLEVLLSALKKSPKMLGSIKDFLFYH